MQQSSLNTNQGCPTFSGALEKRYLTLVYRGTNDSARSIERLFGAIEPYLKEEFEVRRIVVPSSSTSPFGLVRNILAVRRDSRGIVHVTGDVNYVLPFLGRRQSVLTIHDCGTLMNLRGVKKIFYKWIWFKLPCLVATGVTVISQATRDALERLVGSFGEKVSVIDNCIPISIERTSRIFNSTCPSILQVGTGLHKNLDTLIQAIDGFQCELRIIGNPSEADRRELIARQIPHRIESNVTDARIKEIYHEVDILFFASRHEGFGLPILEAQAAGIPVITSSSYSMPWVAGEGGAIFVNPESVNEIRGAIDEIRLNGPKRDEMVRRGSANLERFTAEKVAGDYIQFYKSLPRA
jgi:glycosyltransferase involved in cell wall biosynthesis